MKTNPEVIEIFHYIDGGRVKDIRFDGESIIDHHITHLSYKADGSNPAELELTMKIIPPKIVIKNVPEKNVAVEWDDSDV
jgi:hypothetical protein